MQRLSGRLGKTCSHAPTPSTPAYGVSRLLTAAQSPDAPRALHPTSTVLLTGFEPFGGAGLNPSAEVAQALHGRSLGGEAVVAAVVLTL